MSFRVLTRAKNIVGTLRPYKHVVSLIWFFLLLHTVSAFCRMRAHERWTSISAPPHRHIRRLSSEIASIVCGLSIFGCAWQRYRSVGAVGRGRSVIMCAWYSSVQRTLQTQVNCQCCRFVWWWWWRQQRAYSPVFILFQCRYKCRATHIHAAASNSARVSQPANGKQKQRCKKKENQQKLIIYFSRESYYIYR